MIVSNVSSACGDVDGLTDSEAFLAEFKFYGQGVLVVALGAWGLVGNSLAIVTIASMHKVSWGYGCCGEESNLNLLLLFCFKKLLLFEQYLGKE